MDTVTQTQTPARILVVDDHEIVRLGIRQMIGGKPGLVICGEAATAQAALQMVGRLNANIAIVDLSLDDGHGLELIRALREAAPDVAVLVLSMHDEMIFAERVLQAGARGYIMKNEAIVGLVDAIRQVLAGRIFLSDRMSQRLLSRLTQTRSDPDSPLSSLTDREIEVFELIGRGLSASAIAEAMGVSFKTVATYRANIKAKLNLEDAGALIRLAATWSERL
jgi:DNA-binding NarL/FixJ family response regulator